MNLYEKNQQVLELFNEVEQEILRYQSTHNIKCPDNCKGHCCKKNDIFATILEFLPLAFSLHNKGLADDIHLQAKNNINQFCVLFSRDSGRCLQYENRGLICRLFGFASTRKKDSILSIVTCQEIKKLYGQITKEHPSPIVMADYHRRLSLIDIRLGTKILHINEAIKSAIEITGIFLRYN